MAAGMIDMDSRSRRRNGACGASREPGGQRLVRQIVMPEHSLKFLGGSRFVRHSDSPWQFIRYASDQSYSQIIAPLVHCQRRDYYDDPVARLAGFSATMAGAGPRPRSDWRRTDWVVDPRRWLRGWLAVGPAPVGRSEDNDPHDDAADDGDNDACQHAKSSAEPDAEPLTHTVAPYGEVRSWSVLRRRGAPAFGHRRVTLRALPLLPPALVLRIAGGWPSIR